MSQPSRKVLVTSNAFDRHDRLDEMTDRKSRTAKRPTNQRSSVTDLCFASAGELVEGYRAHAFSPVDVLTAIFERIESINPKINAFVTLAKASAMQEARAAEQQLTSGGELPPLFGVPVSIKDVTPTRGIRTTWGSKLFEHHVPDEDALIVERLKAAGAIVIGKTNTPEFAAGAQTFNTLFGPTRNPWNCALTAAGSSGGAAAALAAGMGPIAEGSDLGGSLRTPAAFCGVIGFRGSPGLVPIYPTQLCWNTLTVQGPMARTTADIARMLSVIAGRDSRDPMSYDVDARAFGDAVREASVAGCRFAWTGDLNGLVAVDPEIIDVAQTSCRVFEELGGTVDDTCPDFSGLDEIVLATRGLSMVALHAERHRNSRDLMQDGLVWNIEQGLSLTVQEIARAQVLRTALYQRVRRFMEDYDFLILPTASAQPFPVEQPYPTEIAGRKLTNYMQWFYIAYAISVTGLPVVSVPCGFTRSGMPVGLQIVGRHRDEASVLRAAAAFERVIGWPEWRPPVLMSESSGVDA